MATATFLLLIVSTFAQVYAALLSDPTQLPAHKTYDYIVVGAGPGGGTVATRLSEDPHTEVLLIEAGPE